MDEERYAAEFLAAHQAISQRGYDHYEVSNAALPGRRARHNSAYWKRAPFIALGPSPTAASAGNAGGTSENGPNTSAPCRQEAHRLGGREELDESAIRLEELYLGPATSRDGLP